MVKQPIVLLPFKTQGVPPWPHTLLTDERRLLIILKQHGVYSKSTLLHNTVEDIFYCIHVDSPWCDIPAKLGCHNSIHCTFRCWSTQNITDMILVQSIQADMEWLCINASHIQSTPIMQLVLPTTVFQAIGINRGGNTSKIYLATDACSNLVRLMLSAGNLNDITLSLQLVDDLDLSQFDTLTANKGYSSSDVFHRQVSERQT